MATNGSNRSSWASNFHLDIEWSRVEVDVPGNRSLIRLTGKLVHTGTGIYFSASKSGSLHGQSFTYTGGFSGTGTKVLRTRDVWVGHNSDGTKTQSFSLSFNPDINYSGSRAGNRTVTVSAIIDPIPRASSLTAFSFAAHLEKSKEVQINYTVDRKSSGFRHQVQLRDGSTTLETWDNQNSDGSSNVKLSAAKVDDLLGRMSNVTSRSLTLRIATRSSSGGGFIGSAVTRNATANVHSNIVPTASIPTRKINGTRKDSAISKYVQNYSKVDLEVASASAGFGATITSRRMIIRHSSNENTNRMEYANHKATTGILTHSGTYNVYSEVTDSRGRTFQSAAGTLVVEAYSPPKITEFSAHRRKTAATTVDVVMKGSWSHIGGLNKAAVKLFRTAATGATTTPVNLTGQTSGAVNTAPAVTSSSEAVSYTFAFTITDDFNNSVSSTYSVSTSYMDFTVNPGNGVGIGKVHETGVLDVSGDTNLNGVLRINRGANNLRMNSDQANGYGYASWHGNTGTRKAYMGIGNNTTDVLTIHNEAGGNLNLVTSGSGKVTINSDEVVASGSGVDGHWVRFYDGTQIWWHSRETHHPANENTFGVLYRSGGIRFPMPVSWATTPVFSGSAGRTVNDSDARILMFGHRPWSTATPNMFLVHGNSSGSTGFSISLMAIGRWK